MLSKPSPDSSLLNVQLMRAVKCNLQQKKSGFPNILNYSFKYETEISLVYFFSSILYKRVYIDFIFTEQLPCFSTLKTRGLFQEAGLLSNRDYFAEETQNPFKSGTWTYVHLSLVIVESFGFMS